MIARVRLALPFVITIPFDEELPTIEYEEGGYRIKVFPPYQANAGQSEIQLLNPQSMRETLEKLSPVTQPAIVPTVTINGRPVYQANALQIVIQKDTFDRRTVLDRNDYDPAPQFIFKVANSFLAKLRSVGQGIDVKVLDEHNTTWRLEYLNDAEEELPHDPNLFRATFGYSFQWRYTLLNKDIMAKVASLPKNYEMQTWETLILDAEALLPDVRASVVLAFSALETLIAVAMDYFVTTSPIPPELWKWINKRDFWLKEPSVEEQYTILLKILTNKSLKDDATLWQAFVDLRKARNSIAHTGKPILNRRAINSVHAGQLVGGAKKIINWIEQLLPENMRRPIYTTNGQINIMKQVI